jgi:hypothetical protein
LVGDRSGFLTVQAAAEGVLDFRQANRFDRNWWRRQRLALEYLDRRNQARLLETELTQRSLELLSPVAHLDATFRKMLIDRIQTVEQQLESSIRPWITFQHQSPEDIIKTMAQRYKEVFLDPASPEFDEELRRLEEHWASGKE